MSEEKKGQFDDDGIILGDGKPAAPVEPDDDGGKSLEELLNGIDSELTGDIEPAVPAPAVAPVIAPVVKPDEKPVIDPVKLKEEITGEITKKFEQKSKEEKIKSDIRELRGVDNAKEVEAEVKAFLKNRPEVADGYIKEAISKGINPLIAIHNMIARGKGEREVLDEMPPEISGKGAVNGTGKTGGKKESPDDEIRNGMLNAGTNDENKKLREELI